MLCGRDRAREDRLEGSFPTGKEALLTLKKKTSELANLQAVVLPHRNKKPANILFDRDNNLYLTDFGIVTWLGEKPEYDGHIMGTPHYIAPEIFEGYVDERSEVYSVGILLYQMLTGYVPFDGSSYQICLDHWKTQPLAP